MVDFRAPNEYAFAALFDALAVPWKYEALEPDISRAIRYQPDFWLPDSLTWVEIKPQSLTPTPGEAHVARLLVEATGRPCYMCAGWPDAYDLKIWVYFKDVEQCARAGGGLAMAWLASLLNRTPRSVTRAGLGVMRRREEFVRMWRESHGKEF